MTTNYTTRTTTTTLPPSIFTVTLVQANTTRSGNVSTLAPSASNASTSSSFVAPTLTAANTTNLPVTIAPLPPLPTLNSSIAVYVTPISTSTTSVMAPVATTNNPGYNVFNLTGSAAKGAGHKVLAGLGKYYQSLFVGLLVLVIFSII